MIVTGLVVLAIVLWCAWIASMPESALAFGVLFFNLPLLAIIALAVVLPFTIGIMFFVLDITRTKSKVSNGEKDTKFNHYH